ncbi:NAD(P)/FAD-dependent oxidoreductase [Candidatus Woesearchaeota archaeon]|nr:NAD(P)/FAD-dependent oxidoreductase [Candidatus Woesearchaeota archaeon]
MASIKILGAGLSGLTAAINLAKAGYKVDVYEKNKDSGIRFSGDLQGLENWSMEKDILEDIKSMNININFSANPFTKLNVYDDELHEKAIMSKRPMFYIVQRGALKGSIDYGLKKQALDAGVKIHYGKTLSEKDIKNDKSNIYIIATGPKDIFAVAVGISFTTSHKDIAIGILDDNIAPKAYGYILVSKGKGCIATVLGKDFINANNYFKKLMQAEKSIINLKKTNIKKISGFGNFHIMDNYFKDGKYWIGEAAGLQDKLWGFGMRYAITSGYLAAKSIIKSRDIKGNNIKEIEKVKDNGYDKLMKERFINQLKTSAVNRFFYEKLGNKGYRYFVNKAKNGPFEFLNKAYNSNFLRTALFHVFHIGIGGVGRSFGITKK